jgi:hypothetical protein
MNSQARIQARSASWLAPRLWLALLVGTAAAMILWGARPAAAQESLELVSAEELREIVGPIALYPDDLVAVVLPASTYPLQVVQAARFLEDRERNSNLQPDEDWDDSIVALLNYPEVVRLMNDDLDWTYDLGTAVLNQRADVLNAIQDFRGQAYAAGNLRSDERQTVARADDAIEIKPANPQVIYVPYYEPERVVIYQPAPVYYYYPRPYPVYYYPYPAGYRFSTGFFWGVNSWFSIGWHSHRVHVYDPFYHGHPYYGWSYYNPFFVRNVYVNVNHYHRYPNYVWEPRYRYGGRPLVRGSEGRVYSAERTPRRTVSPNAAVTRTREGSVYRGNGTATTAARSPAVRAEQPRTSGSAYRERAAVTTQRATQNAQAARAPQVAPRNPNGSAEAAPSRAYRSGATTGSNAGTSPRALERSTGAPREATRVAPATRAPAQAPAARAPVDRGGAGAQRSQSGGSYRGNAGGSNTGGAYRGGGGSQRAAPSAARGSEGRSAAR